VSKCEVGSTSLGSSRLVRQGWRPHTCDDCESRKLLACPLFLGITNQYNTYSSIQWNGQVPDVKTKTARSVIVAFAEGDIIDGRGNSPTLRRVIEGFFGAGTESNDDRFRVK
jgi:hypothetical protein